MGRPYSEDLRSRIVAAVESGASRNAAARQFSVSLSCVVKLMQRFRRTGTVTPAPRGKKPYALAGHEALVGELVAARPDLTLDELHGELGNRGIHVGRSSVNRFLQACGLTLKKVAPCRRTTAVGCCDGARELACWTAFRPRSARLHRRDLGYHQHDAPVRSCATRTAAGRGRPARALEDLYLCCRRAQHRAHCAAGR